MFLNLNKPKGYTSHDVVNVVRKASGIRKVGHAGTLDPLATGVLVVAVSREFTKKISEVVAKEKEYLATIKLGVTSSTDDEEGEKVIRKDFSIPTKKEIQDNLDEFIGEIEQVPPIYSAVKIKGKEAYKYARKGEEIKMKPRKVSIKKIEIVSYDFPTLELKVTTGKGVYIRSLARDIGEKLKTGGYLSDLMRTRVGEFKIEESVEIDDLKEYFKKLSQPQVV